jgi:hypothetical protein
MDRAITDRDPHMSELPCLACGKPSRPAMPGGGRHSPPSDALLFLTYGNYGSTVFDPVTGEEYLLAVICDACVTAAGRAGHVLRCRKLLPETADELWRPQ